jgi:cell wall assembly regulator SMI1
VRDVDTAWAGITGWLAAHAPLTASLIRPPATAADIEALQGELSRPLPDDLVRWWQLVDGFTLHTTYPLIPTMYVPVPVARAREIRHKQLDLTRRFGGTVRATGRAADMSHWFLDAFVPLAVDNCGQVLYADLRRGDWYGSVAEWDHEQGALFPILWRDVTSMLDDIAEALESGGRALGGYADRLRQGRFFADVQRSATVSGDGALAWAQRRNSH